MTVKRYFAETARECLRRVKLELGADAIVVSNKAVDGGVEILAMSPDSLDAISQQAPASAPAPAAVRAAPSRAAAPALAPRGDAPLKQRREPFAASPPAVADDDYTVTLSGAAHMPFRPWAQQHQAARSAESRGAEPRGVEPRGLEARLAEPRTAERTPLRPLPPRSVRQTQAAPSPAQVKNVLRDAATARPAAESQSDSQVVGLMSEMQTIKALLERQLAGFAWGEMARQTPVKALVHAEMLEAGFSALLARRLIDELPPDLSAEDGRKWLKGAINRRLRTLSNENDLIDRGGVFALVGPTGVGKTTTTAKLAARCVVRYGADRLALLTTDGYRIGAHEQLKIYGRILGVQVHTVRDSEDLRRTLADLRDKHMVLIDTVGMSQRDRMVAEQAAMLMRAGEVQRLLMLNATCRGDTLDDVIRAYAGEDLAGCILTKIDETASLAPAIDAVLRHGLLLSYVANGQRVPEDLHLPNRTYLMHRAFKQPADDSAHRLQEGEFGLAVAPADLAAHAAGAALV